MTRSRIRRRRRGLAIIPALVCLVLVSALCGVLLKLAGTHRVLVRSEQRRSQADWLAESGLSRAAARLSADHGYRGETWEIPGGEIAGGAAAVVRITVEPAPENTRRVRVEADYPRAESLRARSSKTLNIHLGPEPTGGPS